MVNLNLVLAALVSVGFVGALIARRIGVPMITGYLVIGMLLSPSVSPLLPKELLTNAAAIITPLALGFVLVNRLTESEGLFSVVYDLEELLYAFFFTLVGTKLDLSLFASGGVLALLIVAGRMSGKFLGATLGATLSGATPAVRKYLGFALLAKAGVTVGLALLVEQDPRMAGVGAILVNGVLASTIINQLIAPPLVKLAIVGSREAGRAEEASEAEKTI